MPDYVVIEPLHGNLLLHLFCRVQEGFATHIKENKNKSEEKLRQADAQNAQVHSGKTKLHGFLKNK